MKCINKLAFLLAAISLVLSGCGTTKYDMPYTADSKISSFRIVESESQVRRADAFSSDLCVSEEDVKNSEIHMSSEYVGAGLFDINSRNVIYSQNM